MISDRNELAKGSLILAVAITYLLPLLLLLSVYLLLHGHNVPGGGFVVAPIHNIQDNTPPENIMAMYKAVHENGIY